MDRIVNFGLKSLICNFLIIKGSEDKTLIHLKSISSFIRNL